MASKKVRRAVILTALPVEYQALKRYLSNIEEVVHKHTIYELGEFWGVTCSWKVLIGEVGKGNVTAAAAAERAISFHAPEVILFVGIAGGIKDVAIGDVVIASKVYGYHSGKSDTEFLPRPDIGRASYRILERAKAESRKDKWLRRVEREPRTPTPRAIVAPIVAGEQVVSSIRSNVFDFIRKNYSDAIAVEMEGRGFLEGTYQNPTVEALVIRGISDLIEGKSASDQAGNQRVASEHAAALAYEILESFTHEASLREDSSSTHNNRVKQTDTLSLSVIDRYLELKWGGSLLIGGEKLIDTVFRVEFTTFQKRTAIKKGSILFELDEAARCSSAIDYVQEIHKPKQWLPWNLDPDTVHHAWIHSVMTEQMISMIGLTDVHTTEFTLNVVDIRDNEIQVKAKLWVNCDDTLRASVRALRLKMNQQTSETVQQCCTRLRELWQYHNEFITKLRAEGAKTAATGTDFWKHVRAQVPQLGLKGSSALVCPASKKTFGDDEITYRGPKKNILDEQEYRAQDPIACCSPKLHVDRSMSVLLKSGEARLVYPLESLHAQAIENTAE